MESINFDKVANKINCEEINKLGLNTYCISKEDAVAILMSKKFVDGLPINTAKHVSTKDTDKIFNLLINQKGIDLLYNDEYLTSHNKYGHKFILNLKPEDKLLYDGCMIPYIKKAKANNKAFGIQIHTGVMVLDFDYRLSPELIQVIMKEFGVNSLLLQASHNNHKGHHIILPIDYSKARGIIKNNKHTLKLVANGKVFGLEYDARGAFSNYENHIPANITVIANYTKNKGLLDNGEERYSDFMLITKDDKLSISEPNDNFYKLNTDHYRDNTTSERKLIAELKDEFSSIKVSKSTEDFLNKVAINRDKTLSNNDSIKDVLLSFNHGKKKNAKKRHKKNTGSKKNTINNEHIYYVGQFLLTQTKKIVSELKNKANHGYNNPNFICDMTEEEARNEIYAICQLITKYTNVNDKKELDRTSKKYSQLIKKALVYNAKIANNQGINHPINEWIDNIENNLASQYISSIVAQFKGNATNDIRIYKGYNQINSYISLFGIAPIINLAEVRRLLEVKDYRYDTSLYGGEVVANINDLFASYESKKEIDKNYPYVKLYDSFNDNDFEYNDELSMSTVLNVSNRSANEIKSRLIKSNSFNNKECIDEPDKIKALLHIWNNIITDDKISTKENNNSKKILKTMSNKYAKLSFDRAEELDYAWKGYKKAFNYILKNSYKAIYASRIKSNNIDTKVDFEFTFKFITDFSINTVFDIAEKMENGEKAPTIKYKLSSRKSKDESYNNLKLNIDGKQQLIKFGSNNLINRLSNKLSKVNFDYDAINECIPTEKKQREYFLISKFNFNYLKDALDKIDANNDSLIKDLSEMNKSNRINYYLILALIFATANYTNRDAKKVSKRISDNELISNNFIQLVLAIESNIKKDLSLSQDELDMVKSVTDNFMFINSTNRVPKLDNKLIQKVINLFSTKVIDRNSYENSRSEFMKDNGIDFCNVNLSTECIFEDRNYAENAYLQTKLHIKNIKEYNKVIAENAKKENNYLGDDKFELAIPNSAFSLNKFELEPNEEENQVAINALINYPLDNFEFKDSDLIKAAINMQKYIMSKFTYDVHALDYDTHNKVIAFNDLQVNYLISDFIKRANKEFNVAEDITKEELSLLPQRDIQNKNSSSKNFKAESNSPYKIARSILNMRIANKVYEGNRNNTIYSIATIIARLVNYDFKSIDFITNIFMDRLDFIIDNSDNEFTEDKVRTILNTIINNEYHFSESDLAIFNDVFGTKYNKHSIFSLVSTAKLSHKRDERTKIYKDEKLHALYSVLSNKRYATLDNKGNKRKLDTNINLTKEKQKFDIDDVLNIANLCNTRIYNMYQTFSIRTAKNEIKEVNSFKESYTPYDMYVLFSMYLSTLQAKDGQNTQSTKGFSNADDLAKSINFMKSYVYAYKQTINTLHTHKMRATSKLIHHSQKFIDMAYKTADKKLNHNGKFNVKNSFWGKLSPNDFMLMLLIDMNYKGNTLFASQMSYEDLMNELLINLFDNVKDHHIVQEVLNSKPQKHNTKNIDLNEENIEYVKNMFNRYILYQKMLSEEYEHRDVSNNKLELNAIAC